MQWNPFSHLIESKKYKLAHLIKSSLWLRFGDTLKVFNGNFMGADEMGILDYVFPFALLSFKFYDYQYELFSKKTDNFTKRLINGTSVAISIFFNTIKFIAAAALTIALSPLITFIHLCVKPFWNRISNQIKNITVSTVKLGSDNSSPEFIEKKKLKDLNNFVLEENVIGPLASTPRSEDGYFHVTYWPAESLIYLGIYSVVYGSFLNPLNIDSPGSGGDELRAVIEVNRNNWTGIKAMLKTNSMWAASNLEKNILTQREDLQEEIEKQIIPHLAKQEFMRGMSRAPRNNSPIKKFVQSPIYHSKLTGLIFEFAGLPKPNKILDSKIFADEKRASARLT